MTILKICLIAVIGVLLLGVIKNNVPAYGVILQVGIVIVVLISALPDIKTLLQALESLDFSQNFSMQGLKVMVKVFSILAVGSVCSDICRDNGENAIAGTVELSSKLAAVACALPVLTAVIGVAAAFLKG